MSQPPSGLSALSYPHHCMVLAPYGECEAEEDFRFTADPKTIAAARNSHGHRVSVSLRLAPPAALSRVCVRYERRCVEGMSATVFAAHGDSVLILIACRAATATYGPYASDYFVYNVGGDPTRPPSLSLLAPVPINDEKKWRLDPSATGLLRHGRDELVVAELQIVEVKDDDDTAANKHHVPELLLFRAGEWCVVRPQFSLDLNLDEAAWEELLSSWAESHAAVPLGDRTLCWLNIFRKGMLLSDALDDRPSLRYLPYPVDALPPCYRLSFLCVDARGGALNLVNLTRRRCSQCGCSEHTQDMDTRTWTLDTDDMAWVVKDDTANCAELWWIDCWPSGYARVHLVYPLVSLDDGGGHAVPDETDAPTEEENAMAGSQVKARGDRLNQSGHVALQ